MPRSFGLTLALVVSLWATSGGAGEPGLGGPGPSEEPSDVTPEISRLLTIVDSKYDATHQRLSNGKSVVAATLDESHKDAPILLLVLTEKDTGALDYDLSLDDTLSSRVYVVRGSSVESEAVAFPRGLGRPSAHFQHFASTGVDAVGPGADSIGAYMFRRSQTKESKESNFAETVLRRAGDHLTDVYSVNLGPGEWFGVAGSPSRFAGFANFQVQTGSTTCAPEKPPCAASITTRAYCWNGAGYALAEQPNCLVSAVSASSTLSEAHAPERAIDGAFETAWCKARTEAARGAWLELKLRPDTVLASLKILPGNGMIDARWKNSDRIKTALVAFDAEPPRSVSFSKEWKLQEVPLPAGHGPISTIRIQIVDVYPGAESHDTCVSEVRLEAEPRSGDDLPPLGTGDADPCPTRFPFPIVGIDHGDIAVLSRNFDSEKLIKAVQMHMGAIERCYDKVCPGAWVNGKLAVRITMNSAGRVSRCEVVEDGLKDESLASCVVSAVRNWSLPFRPQDDVTIELPFIFGG